MAVNLTAGQTGNASESQYIISVQLDGFGSLGVFDKHGGGDVTATPPKYRPGGMGNEITYLGLAVYSDLTVSRVYDEGRDTSIVALCHSLAGKVRGTVTIQALDSDANPWGTPRTYRGRLAAVKDGATDSTSHNPRMWELDFSVEDISN